MSITWNDHLTHARRPQIVGRERELQRLQELADSPSPGLLHLHGPGGVGKSLLVRTWLSRSGLSHEQSLVLDGGSVTAMGPRALLDMLPRELRLLVIDDFDQLRAQQGWLRETLLPRLDASVRVLTVGRRPLEGEWRTDPGWQAHQGELHLKSLSEEAAQALLLQRGLPAPEVRAVLAVVGTHPLALRLAADAVLAHRGQPPSFSFDAYPHVAARLLDTLELTPSDALQQRALQDAAARAVTTFDALRSAMELSSAVASYGYLSTHPGFESAGRGLAPRWLSRQLLLWAHPAPSAQPLAPVTVLSTRPKAKSGVIARATDSFDRDSFDTAVRSALRNLHDIRRLQNNPLVWERLVGGEGHGVDLHTGAAALRADLLECCRSLGDTGHDGRYRELLERTYFQGPAKQLAVAIDMGMGYSTYRRHLARAVTALCDLLWSRQTTAGAQTHFGLRTG